MLQLIELFQELHYDITFASAAQQTERSYDLSLLGVKEVKIELNSSSFDQFVSELSPDVVLYDRFISEEQFGWRVAEQVPDAFRILDSEDFHGLRKARELALKQGVSLGKEQLQNDISKRELAAMYRCDITLVISEAEIKLLTEEFQFPEFLMLYMPFLHTNNLYKPEDLPKYGERHHFMTVGNYLHPPNADAVNYLKNDIWPSIRSVLPDAELHVYGAYQSLRAQQLQDIKQGFIIKGAVPKINSVMWQYRVCLAPLRFGAGLKGKLFDAMQTGTPAVMTQIAAEGLFGAESPNGFICDDPKDFASKAIAIYSDKALWTEKQNNGYSVLEKRFVKSEFLESLETRLDYLLTHIKQHRQDNFLGQLFLQQTLLASKYLSKWIETKNQKK
jgi:glycosyltransferase involved in cell wall biosynthesis